MLPLLRPILRRSPRLNLQRPQFLLSLRLQHDQYGPHKEYFQHPSQFPSNAYQLRVPPPDQRLKPEKQETIHQHAPPGPKKPSLQRRLIRGTLVVSLSLALGWAAGTAIITFDYIQPPPEPGSEEAEELTAEVDSILDTCSMTEDLRQRGFQEEPMHRPSHLGQHLVAGTLNDVQGFKTKFFRHPEFSAFSVLVFFAGFGTEGWPDYVHGGAITTIMTEAAEQHCMPILDSGDFDALPSGQFVNVSFLRPVRPAEVYMVLVQETSACIREREAGDPRGYADGYVPEAAIAHNVNTFLISSDSLPHELFEHFPTARVQDVPTAQEERTEAEDTEEGNSFVDINAGDSLHAFGQIDVMTKSKRITKNEDESPIAFGNRLEEELRRVLVDFHKPTQAGPRVDEET